MVTCNYCYRVKVILRMDGVRARSFSPKAIDVTGKHSTATKESELSLSLQTPHSTNGAWHGVAYSMAIKSEWMSDFFNVLALGLRWTTMGSSEWSALESGGKVITTINSGVADGNWRVKVR